ncbi:MAG: methyltransferase [Bacteroidota bacterium]|nr:methyltransferase [Bacteroidota bacterium]
MLQQKLTPTLERRFVRTLDFLQESMPAPARILDLGGPNLLAERMRAVGYEVSNTEGDLDDPPSGVRQSGLDAVTAFEILEHLVAPLNVLRAIEAPRLFATVPLRLWFATAYRNPNDPLDQHFHEFEDWQFDWLLERAGWTIVRRAKWTSTFFGIGLRPLLRTVTPRLYAVEAVRWRDD